MASWAKRGLSAGLAVGAFACADPAEQPAVAEPTPADAIAMAVQQAAAEAAPEPTPGPAASPAQPPAPVVSGSGPQVLLVWDNVGSLYQSFFSVPEVVTDLSDGLAGQVNGPVNVYIKWDDTAFVGTIRLRVLPGTLIAPPLGQGNVIPLQQLAPITTALASYRSEVANRFDVRVASFKVSVESFSGARHCLFEAVGRPPPDGRVVSPCVVLNGQQRCGEPGPNGVTFSPELAEDIRACLQPKG